MRRSGIGNQYSAFVAVTAIALIGSVGRADSLGSPLYYSSLVVADATHVAEPPAKELLSLSAPVLASQANLPLHADADSSNDGAAESGEPERYKPVPEPSGIVLGAFFAALFALVMFLRWRFDRAAVRA